jgi:AhpD family alkylhydroperoxidase
MARLPYVDPEQAPPEVREALEALPPLNIFRTLAHAETCLRPALRLGGAILGAQELDARLRELAILRVARLTAAEYEWIQHAAIGRAVGVTEEQLAALANGDYEAECFGPDDRLVLRVATEVIEDTGVSEPTFTAARERFSSREIVELIVAAGYYQLLAALMNSVDIDLDEPMGTAVIDSAVSRRDA